jgi:hypothetical protein
METFRRVCFLLTILSGIILAGGVITAGLFGVGEGLVVSAVAMFILSFVGWIIGVIGVRRNNLGKW